MGNYKSLSPCPEIDLRAKKQYRSIAPCQTTFRDGSYSLYHTSKRRYLDVIEIIKMFVTSTCWTMITNLPFTGQQRVGRYNSPTITWKASKDQFEQWVWTSATIMGCTDWSWGSGEAIARESCSASDLRQDWSEAAVICYTTLQGNGEVAAGEWCRKT